ncbi:MAG: hypothetical protein ACRYG8_11200 [Janthinobacterium lividum]
MHELVSRPEGARNGNIKPLAQQVCAPAMEPPAAGGPTGTSLDMPEQGDET